MNCVGILYNVFVARQYGIITAGQAEDGTVADAPQVSIFPPHPRIRPARLYFFAVFRKGTAEGRGEDMLGFTDGWITLVYVLCILSALLCAVYGILNWNKGTDKEAAQILEAAGWEKNESEIEKDL